MASSTIDPHPGGHRGAAREAVASYRAALHADPDPWAATGAVLALSLLSLPFANSAVARALWVAGTVAAGAAALVDDQTAEAVRALWGRLHRAAWRNRKLRGVLPKPRMTAVPANPGAVLWAWVPFERPSADGPRGKDRPVVVLGFNGTHWLGVPLTTKPRDAGRIEVGVGEWDPQGRVSFADPRRVVAVPPKSVRRCEGRVAGDRLAALQHAVGERYGPGSYGAGFTGDALRRRAVTRSRAYPVLAAGWAALAAAAWLTVLEPLRAVLGWAALL